MKGYSLLIFYLIYSVATKQSKRASQSNFQQFEDLAQYSDSWYSLDTIYGKFQQTHTLFSDPKCNPCEYMITIYTDYIELLIQHPKTGTINAFEFQVDQQQGQVFEFDRKDLKIIAGVYEQQNINEDGQEGKGSYRPTGKYAQKISRFSRDGLQWIYEFTLPIQGIILQGNHLQNRFIVPIVSIIFAVLAFICLPLRSSMRSEIFTQTTRRTPIVSILMISQLQHFVLLYLAFILGKYLIWQTNSFVFKPLWYVTFMIPISIMIVQILYMYNSIKQSYLQGLKSHQNNQTLKNVGLLGVYLIAIYIVIGILFFVQKQIWFAYYLSLCYTVQLVYSLVKRKYPYMPLVMYFYLCLSFLIFLNNYIPLFNYEQNTRLEIIWFYAYLVVFFILGTLLQKQVIKVQIVNQVKFQEVVQTNKGLEMRNQNIGSKSYTSEAQFEQ